MMIQVHADGCRADADPMRCQSLTAGCPCWCHLEPDLGKMTVYPPKREDEDEDA